MGFSKRHKTDKSRERDSKKKHHRSRSRSHSLEREKNDKHKHHKKHKKRDRKDYDSDVESVDAPPPPKISKTSHHASTPPPPPEISRSKSPSPKKENSQASLSIEETNKLRAKLGLKPLQVDSECRDKDGKREEGKYKDDYGEFYHKPAQNVADKQRSDKIKERLADHKQRRQIENNLMKVKTLGESDSDDDAKAWVEKSRKLSEEKRKAEERAKMLDQMDEEFGVGNLVEEEVRKERRRAYREKDLMGLTVEHDIETFEEGSQVILTLKDQDILEGNDDVLVNVNMKDDERYRKNVEIKSKKANFYANDGGEEMDEDDEIPGTNILTKYDEEISGKREKSFVLGAVVIEKKKNKLELLKESLENKRLESLEYDDPRIAGEYYDPSEVAKFKKVKKKVRKNRTNRVLKADDLVTDSTDYLRDLGSRRRKKGPDTKKEPELKTDDIEAPTVDLSNVKVDYEERDVHSVSKKQLKKSKLLSFDKVSQVVKQEIEVLPELNKPGNIVLDSTAEFCRTLGEIPTYGLAGNREDNDQEMLDFEQTTDVKIEEEMDIDESDGRGTWNTVLADKKQSQPIAAEATILDEEPLLDQGVGGALKLALSKGYLQKEDSNRPSASRFAHLQAQNYSIEDKTYGDDDKFGRRDRFNGPSSDFKEKDGYKPNVKLEYIDDDGHILNAKEAFRYLSHKFHGKGPGKNKVEKRMKKAEQQVLMKRMSSTDTPLGTLTLLQAKQKETQSPFIVLSGSKQMQATTISKTKH